MQFLVSLHISPNNKWLIRINNISQTKMMIKKWLLNLERVYFIGPMIKNGTISTYWTVSVVCVPSCNIIKFNHWIIIICSLLIISSLFDNSFFSFLFVICFFLFGKRIIPLLICSSCSSTEDCEMLRSSSSSSSTITWTMVLIKTGDTLKYLLLIL